jgi:hypothetical protein
MKTTHDSIQDLPIQKAQQSRPTREEILEGIGYTPLTFPASLHVPEALRAKEERANQDYVVAWVQGLWDFIQAHENDPDPRAKLAQDPSAGRQRARQARAKASPSRDQPNQISLKETKYPAGYFTPGQCALLDMPNPHGYTLGERMRRAKGARLALLIAEERQHKARWFYLSFATGYAFLGAAIVRGYGFLTAIQRATDLNINPDGGVMSRALNWRHMKRIPTDLRNRLLSKEEVDTRLEVLGH